MLELQGNRGRQAQRVSEWSPAQLPALADMDSGENTRINGTVLKPLGQTSRTKKNKQKVLSCCNMASEEQVGVQQWMASRHLNGEIKSFLLLAAQLSFCSNLKLNSLRLLQRSLITLFFLGVSFSKVSLAGHRKCCQFVCQDAWPPHRAFACGNDPHRNMVCYKEMGEIFITAALSNLQDKVQTIQIQREIGHEKTATSPRCANAFFLD